MRIPLVATVLSGILVVACDGGGGGPAAPLENPPVSGPGDYELRVSSSGGTRGYSLHVPAGWNGTSALPVLLVFHGVPRGTCAR